VIPAQVSVVVVDSGFGATCSVDPENINTGGSATWTASAVGGTGSYTYSWSGSSSLSGTLNPMPKTYTTPGNKTAQVVVNSGTESATAACSNSVFVSNAPTQCSDLVDNADPEDFLADMADPGCTSPSDNDETNVVVVTQCSDGVDNTDPEDFLIDMADPGCTSPSDNDETNISGPFCGDGVINQASEECDGADLSGKTCLALGYSRGTLSCTSCKFNLNKCVKIREN
jgi:hypothetical protein